MTIETDRATSGKASTAGRDKAAAGCLEQICRVLDGLTPAELEIIEPHLVAWLRRARRLLARDAAVQALGAHYPEVSTGRGRAAALRRDLQRYAASGWRFEQDQAPAGGGKRALMHLILRLNQGKLIAAGQIRTILAGLR